MGKKLATVLAAVVATGHQGAVVQTAVQVTCGYSGQVYTRPSPPPATGPALTTQDSQYTSSSKVLPFYLGKWGPFTCSLYMVTFQVITPHLPRQV